MIDIGEDLVGAYLSKAIECPVVQFNVRTGVDQGEIDVVGLRVSGSKITEVWFCEVSTHTRGLGGYKGDVAGKLAAKIASVKEYAGKTYPGIPRHIEIWSPRVAPATMIKLHSLLDNNGDVVLVVNDEYADRVRRLVELAKKQTALSDSPSFRLLQILARLTKNPFE